MADYSMSVATIGGVPVLPNSSIKPSQNFQLFFSITKLTDTPANHLVALVNWTSNLRFSNTGTVTNKTGLVCTSGIPVAQNALYPPNDSAIQQFVSYNSAPSNGHNYSFELNLYPVPGFYGNGTVTVSLDSDYNGWSSTHVGTLSFQIQTVTESGIVPLPTAPVLTAISSTAISTNIGMQWTASAPGTITIERSLAGGSSFAIQDSGHRSLGGTLPYVVQVDPPLPSSFNGYGLNPSTTYYYRAKATNLAGTSVYSSIVSIATDALPSSVAAPTNLSGVANTTTQIALTWTPSTTSLVNRYKVYRSVVDGGSYTLIATIGTAANYVDNGVSASTTYYYVVKADILYGTNNNQDFLSSNSNQATVLTPDVPGTPTAPSSLTSSTHTTKTVTLGWTDNSTNEDNFILQRAVGSVLVFATVATLPAGTTSYVDTGLIPATTYSYRVAAQNAVARSAYSNTLAVTTSALPAIPSTPTGLTAAALSSTQITLSWTDAATNEDAYQIYHGLSSTGLFLAATISAGSTTFVDAGLAPGSTYYYAVRAVNEGGQSPYSNIANATTLAATGTLAAVSAFTLDPAANIQPLQVAGRLFWFSDLDRAKVYVNRKWFEVGIKPQLTKATISDGGAATSGLTGTFTVYIVLYSSDRVTRSIPGPVSDAVTLSNKKLTIVPPNNGTLVTCRDVGYDSGGNEIQGADRWEIYVKELNLGDAYLVAQLPMTTLTYTTSTTLSLQGLTDGSHRPMEQGFQSLIAPACSKARYFNNRIWLFGETTIKPTQAEIDAGSICTVATGSTTVILNATVDPANPRFVATDALFYKELFINKSGTGWFVVDVIDGQTLKIRNPDDAVNTQGFNGTSGNFHDFAFGGHPSRVYTSAYFTGEASGGVTFSPETFPPDTIFEQEFDPDDNTDPTGAITVRDALFVAKPGKWFMVTGGSEPDFPLINVQAISRGSGMRAPYSIALDRFDRVYYMADTGLHRVTQSGVEKVIDQTGNAHFFQDVFDIDGIASSVGVWFSREDYYVCFGLNRKGSTGNRDGFIFDSRNNMLFPFTLPVRGASVVECDTVKGDFQLLCGDGIGELRGAYTLDYTSDNVDRTLSNKYFSEVLISARIRSGLVSSQNGYTTRSFRPRVKQNPLQVPTSITMSVDGKSRNSDPYTFTSEVSATFDSNITQNKVSVGGLRSQTLQYELTFDAPSSINPARIEVSGIGVEIIERPATQ